MQTHEDLHGWFRLRRRALLVCAIAVLAQNTYAQTPPAAVTLDGLQTPSSPAFTLLGVAPTSIERPTTPQGLAFNLLAASAKGDNLIPRDYAVEVAPYWLKNHASLSYNTYFAPSTTQSIAQTLSFSFVTSKPAGSPDGTTDIGFGARTSIRAGHASRKVRDLLKALAIDHIKYQIFDAVLDRVTRAGSPAPPPTLPKDIEAILDPKLVQQSELTDAEIKDLVSEMRTSLLQIWAATTGPSRDPMRLLMEGLSEVLTAEPTNPADAERWREARAAVRDQLRAVPVALDAADIATRVKVKLAALESRFSDTSGLIQANDKIRRGFILNLAGAVASRVAAAGGLTDARFRQAGLWVTSAYRTDGPLVDFIALARVISRAPEEGEDVFDFGAQFVHQPGALLWAAEYVQRIEKGDAPTTQRVGVNVEYKIRDNLVLTAAFGKDFANPSLGSARGGLVSVLGLNFGFSSKSAVTIAGAPKAGS